MRWETALAAERVERKLAAILAADIAGYSRLMGADEEGTLARLKGHRRELIDPKIAEYRGRVVKTTGDGMLVEFGSVVDALRCATEVQVGMAERNAEVPSDQRIDFRVGIHMGDVVVDDGDIFGDAVNVAARLEGLAQSGGICVSARVRGDAASKLDWTISMPSASGSKRSLVASPVSRRNGSTCTSTSRYCSASAFQSLLARSATRDQDPRPPRYPPP